MISIYITFLATICLLISSTLVSARGQMYRAMVRTTDPRRLNVSENSPENMVNLKLHFKVTVSGIS